MMTLSNSQHISCILRNTLKINYMSISNHRKKFEILINVSKVYLCSYTYQKYIYKSLSSIFKLLINNKLTLSQGLAGTEHKTSHPIKSRKIFDRIYGTSTVNKRTRYSEFTRGRPRGQRPSLPRGRSRQTYARLALADVALTLFKSIDVFMANINLF